MPTWEDYLRLAFDEIRQYGVSSVQVMRRLRSALHGIAESAVIEGRAAAVERYLGHLDLVIERSPSIPKTAWWQAKRIGKVLASRVAKRSRGVRRLWPSRKGGERLERRATDAGAVGGGAAAARQRASRRRALRPMSSVAAITMIEPSPVLMPPRS